MRYLGFCILFFMIAHVHAMEIDKTITLELELNKAWKIPKNKVSLGAWLFLTREGSEPMTGLAYGIIVTHKIKNASSIKISDLSFPYRGDCSGLGYSWKTSDLFLMKAKIPESMILTITEPCILKLDGYRIMTLKVLIKDNKQNFYYNIISFKQHL